MTKAIFATIGLMLILSTNLFGQPGKLHNPKKPSGLITEYGIPGFAVKANSTKSNKARKVGKAPIVNGMAPILMPTQTQ